MGAAIEDIYLLENINQIARGNESPCDCLKDIFKQRTEIAKRFVSSNSIEEKRYYLGAIEYINERIKEALSL